MKAAYEKPEVYSMKSELSFLHTACRNANYAKPGPFALVACSGCADDGCPNSPPASFFWDTCSCP